MVQRHGPANTSWNLKPTDSGAMTDIGVRLRGSSEEKRNSVRFGGASSGRPTLDYETRRYMFFTLIGVVASMRAAPMPRAVR